MYLPHRSHCAIVLAALVLALGVRAQEGSAPAAPASPPPPDEVFLKNGDKLTGKIVGLKGGTLTIDTAYAGKVEVKWSEVASMNAPGGLDFVLKGGEALKSPAARSEDGSVKVDASALAEEQLALESVEKINPAPIAWTGNIAAGFEFKRGNIDEDSATVTGLAQRETDTDRITARGRYNSSRVRNQSTGEWQANDRYIGGSLQYDLFLSKDWFLYGLGSAERDRNKTLDLRYLLGVGAGWQFLQEDDLKGSLEGGVNFISESYKIYPGTTPPGTPLPVIDPNNNDYFAARLALNLDWQILENLRYLQYTQYFPSLEDKDKFLVNSQHTLRLSVTGNLFVQGGVIFDYDSQPGGPGAEKLDVKYLAQLGWSF